jgi:hypothetical protein
MKLLKKQSDLTPEVAMPDNLKNRGPQDRSRIAMGEEHEVFSWMKKLRVSRDRL